MSFRVIGHPDLEQQVHKVFAADPREGPPAVARIRALLESLEGDPANVEPAPVARQSWTQGIRLNVENEEGAISSATARVTIYVYEAWALRFGLARVELPGDVVVGAWLMVETQVAAAAGLASRNLSLALLAQVEELRWPI
jgi:hypothetical protein